MHLCNYFSVSIKAVLCTMSYQFCCCVSASWRTPNIYSGISCNSTNRKLFKHLSTIEQMKIVVCLHKRIFFSKENDKTTTAYSNIFINMTLSKRSQTQDSTCSLVWFRWSLKIGKKDLRGVSQDSSYLWRGGKEAFWMEDQKAFGHQYFISSFGWYHFVTLESHWASDCYIFLNVCYA